jgi:magnesium-transporting ATPase (P-type)
MLMGRDVNATKLDRCQMRSVRFSSARSQRYVDLSFPPNIIHPGVRSIFNLVPSCLYIVFSRSTYLFHLVIFIVQLVCDVYLTISVTLVPLIGTVLTAAVVDTINLVRRNRLIAGIDRRKVLVVREHEWIEIPWRAVAVGDLIKLSNGDVAPADVVLLCTTNGSLCAIDTHIIDGSHQLRKRMPLGALHGLSQVITNCEFLVNYSRESAGLASKILFHGTFVSGDKTAELGNPQFIERYSSIHQHGDIICGVLYTGRDCRTVQNLSNPFVKFTRLERTLNIQNLMQLLLMVVVALIMAGFSATTLQVSRHWPFSDTRPFVPDVFLDVFRSYLTLLLPLSPIELYMVLDIILYIHSLFLQAEPGTTVPSLSVIDELTQIDTIVVSKPLLIGKNTNVLRIFVNDTVFGRGLTACHLANNIETGILRRHRGQPQFEDTRFEVNNKTQLLFLHMTTCHSALPVTINETLHYVSNFPEDEGILQLAAGYGFVLTRRTNRDFMITIGDTPTSIPVLQMFAPSPQHRRVSVIVRDIDGSVKLLTRGDCETMRNCVDVPQDAEFEFKSEGLRVMCCSYKLLSDDDLAEFEAALNQAVAVGHEAFFSVLDVLESGQLLVGLIAFEEEVRDSALSFVHQAQSAGLQLVLASPGRADSTSITALSLGMISQSQQAGIVKGDQKETVDDCVRSLLNSLPFDVLSIQGTSVPYLPVLPEFVELLGRVPVVLLEASHAGEFVQFLRRHCHKVVLGMGHSVVDSLFLECANISVAVQVGDVSPCDLSSDVTCNRLESVSSMLFVQGCLLRERLQSLLNYIFPRNTIYGFLQCAYGLYSGLSGTPLFSASQVLATLIFFTMVPAVSRAIFNQKVPSSVLKMSPDYYKITRADRLSWWRFLVVTLMSAVAAGSLLEVSRVILMDGRTPYQDSFSHAQFQFAVDSAFVICCISFIVPACQTWPKVQHVLVWGSAVLYYIWTRAVSDSVKSGQMRGAAVSVSSIPVYSLTILLYCGLSLFFRISYILFKRLPRLCDRRTPDGGELLPNAETGRGVAVRVANL